MREMTTITEEVTHDILDDLCCDRCGHSMRYGERGEHMWSGATFRASFGYGSNKDMTSWEIELCDDCADWLRLEMKEIRETNWF